MAAAAAVPVGTEFVALLIEMKRGLHVKIEKALFCENFKRSLQVKKATSKDLPMMWSFLVLFNIIWSCRYLCCFRFQKLWCDLRWNRTTIRMISCFFPKLFPCCFDDFRIFTNIDCSCCDDLTGIKHSFVRKITFSAGNSLPAVGGSSYRPGACSTLGERTNPAHITGVRRSGNRNISRFVPRQRC